MGGTTFLPICLVNTYSWVQSYLQTICSKRASSWSPPLSQIQQVTHSTSSHNFKGTHDSSFNLTCSHCCCCLVAKLCLTLCDAMDGSPPGSSVHGILQIRILEWVASPFSRVSSWPRDWIHVSLIGNWILSHGATWEAPYICISSPNKLQTVSQARLYLNHLCTQHLTLLLTPGPT